MARAAVGVLLVVLAGSAPAVAGDRTPLQPSRSALPAISAPVTVAQDTSCASACQARHDQCRVATKGSQSCDVERQRCLQACLNNKRR